MFTYLTDNSEVIVDNEYTETPCAVIFFLGDVYGEKGIREISESSRCVFGLIQQFFYRWAVD
jgi:hypothetical protein